MDGSAQESVSESGLPLGSASGSRQGELPPRNLRRLIGETFRIYRRNFWPLVIIATIPQAVLFLAFVTPVVGAILGLVGGFLCMIALGATIYAVTQQHIGRKVAIVESYRRAFSNSVYLTANLGVAALLLALLFLFYSMAIFLYYMVIFLWFYALVGVLLVGPIALYFVVFWFFTPHAIIVENKGLGAAFGRSRALVRGYWWRTLRMGIVLLLITLLIMYIPVIMLIALGSPEIAATVFFVLSCVPNSLAFPIIAIGSTLVYFDLRARHEGYTLQQMATEVRAG